MAHRRRNRLRLGSKDAAFLTTAPISNSALISLPDGRAAVAFYDGVYLKTLDTARQTRTLRLQYDIFADDPQINADFMAQRPDIVLSFANRHFSDAEDFYVNHAASGLDILIMNTQFDPWPQVRDKAYARSLADQPAIVQSVNAMYPAIAEAVSVQGQPHGLPVRLQPTSLSRISRYLTEDYGFPEDQLPRSLVDIPRFLRYWAEHYMDNYPNTLLFGNQQSARPALQAEFFSQYTAPYERKGEAIDFDTPIFRQGLRLYGDIPYIGEDANEALWLASANISQPLITSMPSSPVMRILPLPAAEGLPYWLKVSLQIMFINPHSQQQEDAAAHLSFVAQHLPRSFSVLAKPDDNQPIDYEDYEAEAASSRRALADAQSALAKANRHEAEILEAQIKWLEGKLNNPDSKYLASQKWMRAYRQIAQHMVIAHQSFFDFDPAMPALFKNIADTLKRYRAGQVDEDYVVAEFQRIERMRTLESQ